MKDLTVFVCPVCGGGLRQIGQSLRCERGHSFDIARQGYVSLVSGSRATGDTADMVRARTAFLDSGIYEPVAQQVVDMIQARRRNRTEDPNLLADLGGGTGWYSAYVLDRIPALDGVLVDVSAHAAKAAARAHPRLTVATADLWKSIPLPDASVDVAMVVFAPRNPDEILRILAPGGLCLVVVPQPNHLKELRSAHAMLAIEPEKEARLAEQFSRFRTAGTSSLEYRRLFSPHDIANVIGMGPSAFHRRQIPIADLEPAEVTVAVAVHQFILSPL